MSHFGDFMDGVPVKISEKYKRPPTIELPYSVTECPCRAQQVVDNVKHCFTFENNVLAKLTELRNAKETRKNERIYRLQLLEEAKQKKLDLIAAAEAEEKFKQLSVSEVSYPSTEEISEISPDDRDKYSDATVTQETVTNTDLDQSEVVQNNDVNYPLYSTTHESQSNILQPIQVRSQYQETNLIDDPDPLQELKINNHVKMSQYNPMYSRHIDKLTFSDFENDTSSPFDNVELKTINDMELLAQVLQTQHAHTSNLPQQTQFFPDQTYPSVPNCASQAQMPYLPNTYMEQPMQGPEVIYTQNSYPVANGYYVPSETVCDSNMPTENVNLYMPNYHYYVPTNSFSQTVAHNYYPNQNVSVDTNELAGQLPNDTYIPQPYYFQYPQVPMEYPQMYNPGVSNQEPERTTDILSSGSHSTIASRSRSVPDIVKELDEELVSAKLRANERSYNASPAPKESLPRSSSSKRSKRKIEKLPNPFEKLPQSSQSICQKIQAMGFPLDRVARVCTIVGDNDKKLIESLLLWGELMDLGFPEGRVCRALCANNFNRDKALDELIK